MGHVGERGEAMGKGNVEMLHGLGAFFFSCWILFVDTQNIRLLCFDFLRQPLLQLIQRFGAMADFVLLRLVHFGVRLTFVFEA